MVFILTITRKWKAINRNLYLNLANSMLTCIKLVIESDNYTIDY